ncbi:immune inhibitor A domain-containing protein [Embleya scabrispora]|uniref:immune inhibitor A domain-containing protein n=1 Tax=Embleya scabrispora TaxID=159449 RepID=UPI000378C89F|nr:immune inhibitor A domain-containing protein [Embleya scabrispora]MYS81960.1 M6 family metalloprotease domain-containing protein [Streptomyces sp. SID5474]
MKPRRVTPAVVAALCALLVLSAAPAAPGSAAEAPAEHTADAESFVERDDDLPHPFTERRRQRRDAAVRAITEKPGLAARTVPAGKVGTAETRPPAEARVFVILVEFGDRLDAPNAQRYGSRPGPRHGAIPAPDRARDTTTMWRPSYERDHYQDLFFGPGTAAPSLASYYRGQSAGRYSIDGEVTDWVRVPYNEARYGNDGCGRNVCRDVWDLVQDAMKVWYDGRLAQGLTPAQVREQLASFDRWDRDDFDGDGDFDEPDGYLDNVEIVHAGVDKAQGGGEQGRGAVWSHRWYAYADRTGHTGPAANRAGGTPIGDSGIWVGDYTIQSENGGLGVIAHEFGHNLGLPDLYDRDDSTDGPPGFWSLMALGGYLGDEDGAGSLPGSLSAWDKLQLGWLDVRVVDRTRRTVVQLAPNQSTGDPQALLIPLPPRRGSGGKRWYLVENRQYVGADTALVAGPYQITSGKRVATHFPYGEGVLIWLWDTSYTDNDVSRHPGEGLILPVDIHPTPLLDPNGKPLPARFQTADAALTAPDEQTSAINLGRLGNFPSRPGVPTFTDTIEYWSATAPDIGVKVPATGTRITAEGPTRNGNATRLTVGPTN